MKKKTRKFLLPVILFLILMALMPVQAQAANRTATTVRMKTYYKSGKKFMTVRGLDSRSRLVWKYTTKSYPATELKQITCLVRADKVYVFESSKVIAFRKKDGRRLWSTSKISPAGHVFGFDRYDNLYVTGYYDKYVYRISTKGKIVWKTNTSRTGNYWPYKVTASGNYLTILYDMNSRNYSSRKVHKIIFNMRNGRIVRYS